MILNIVSGKARNKMPPLYTLSGGTSSYQQSVAADGTVNWELAILSGSSKTLTFSRVVDKVDVFLVGGGAAGAASANSLGGTGGSGGACTTAKGVSVSAGTAYTFTVGGSGTGTSIFGKSASSGGGSAGGLGADYQSGNHGKTGSDGVYAFGSSTSLLYSGRKYGAGGGGGGYVQGTNSVFHGGDGGASGGGPGADRSHTTAASASGTANTGGGGGGGCYDGPYNLSYDPGAGGSGIIIIRNARG